MNDVKDLSSLLHASEELIKDLATFNTILKRVINNTKDVKVRSEEVNTEEEDCGGYRGDGGNDPDNYAITKSRTGASINDVVILDLYPKSGLPEVISIPGLVWGRWSVSDLCFKECRIPKTCLPYISVVYPECSIVIH